MSSIIMPVMQGLGEMSAVLTSVCWSASSVAFTLAGRRVGSASVNHIRLWLALAILVVIHAVIFHTPFPVHAGNERFLWLGLSGFLGFVIADGLLFESFVLLGPQMSMLLMTLSPAFGTFLAWIFLAEHPSAFKIAGIAVTMIGIAIVVSESGKPAIGRQKPHWYGIGLGIGAAIGQAAGFLLSKLGMQGAYSAFSANLIRLTAATAGITVMTLIRKQLIADFRKMSDGRAFVAILFGTLCGPVLGVIFALYAITHTFIGIAVTLTALPPVFLLPISHFVFGERISARAIVGTIVSLAGVMLLFVITH